MPCLPVRCNLSGGRLPERPMGADCKSVGLRLHRFESCTCHQGLRTSRRVWVAFAGARIPEASHRLTVVGSVGILPYPGIAQERTAVRVPGPPSRQPRIHRTVPQGKSRHVTRASGGRPRVASPESGEENDRAKAERDRRGATQADYRVVRAHSLRRAARTGADHLQMGVSARSLAVVRGRRLARKMGRLRCPPCARPVHCLLQGHGWRHHAVVMAGMRRLPRRKRGAGVSVGISPIGTGTAQPDE